MQAVLILFVVAVIGYVVSRLWRRADRLPPTTDRGARATDTSFEAGAPSEDDAYEGGFLDNAADPVAVDARVQIVYRDAAGTTSRRVIRVCDFDRANANGYLNAFCEMRGAHRTFRLDRVQRAVDVSTGEVLASLHQHLLDLYNASPMRSLERFADAHGLQLDVLMYVARADGAFRKAEKEIVLRFARERISDARLTDDEILKLLTDFGSSSLTAFRRDVGKLTGLPETERQLMHALAAEMVATQKTVHPAEQDALLYLANRLGVAATA